MKIIVASLVCLLVGSGIGYYFGYTRPTAKTDRDVLQELQKQEGDDCNAAIFALTAIPLIESGETQKAVLCLSFPLEHYYVQYHNHTDTNELRLKICARIEQLASTNQVVADAIHRTNN